MCAPTSAGEALFAEEPMTRPQVAWWCTIVRWPIRLVIIALLIGRPWTLGAQSIEPPALLLGSFTDDYGYAYRITHETFEMGPRTRYRIVAWEVGQQFLIARADSTAALPGGTWLRIDWTVLPAMAPYTWAYCFTAYDAPTADSARATASADRANPRTGCGGYPFSRMKRAEDLSFPSGPAERVANQ